MIPHENLSSPSFARRRANPRAAAAIACAAGAFLLPLARGADEPRATDWLRDARLGVFMHFLPGDPAGLAKVDAFDVPAVAAQLREMGAGYFVLTLGQNSGFFNSPNRAYDRITGYAAGERCARRDLPLDLQRALAPEGIKLMLYLPCQTPNQDRRAQRAFGIREGPADQPIDEAFARKWAEVIAEWSVRYGDRVAGWWFDGGYAHVGFNEAIGRIYAEAAKRGNPRAIVTFNPGVKLVRHTRAEDYTAGELNDPFDVLPASRWVDGSQWHALTFLGSAWARRDVRHPVERWVAWASAATAKGGAVTLDLGPTWDERTGPIGTFDAAQAAQVKAVRAAVGTASANAPRPQAAAPRKPNVVFILADDLGWADTTLYGRTKFYRTPNVDRLARRGMTFTRAYSASPLCSPTRASIMTGLSPARTGITAPVCHVPEALLEAAAETTAPPDCKATVCRSATRLVADYFTLAEALKAAGYATGHFGKWHLGPQPYSPIEHGFDVDVPHWPGPGPAGSYVAPWRFPSFKERAPAEHIEDRMAAEAAAFIDAHKDRPFFLNYWQFSVHAPFDAKQALIEKYRAKVDPADPQRSPTYAAMVESFDDAIGTLLDALDRCDLADTTIIVFTSDNGGNMYSDVDGTAPTSNAPLRGGKATLYEGGVRVPCVVCWPGVVAGGARSDAVVQSTDFYPTLLDMLGIAPREGQVFDGVSIVPALKGGRLARESIFTFFPHNPRVPDWLPPAAAVHKGEWKLIRIFHGGEGGAHRFKLFDLANDLGEANDLAAKEPARVEELDALIERFLADTKAVLPLPNPRFDPAAFRPEDEGKSRRTEKEGAAAAGWTPSRDCTLALRDGALVITATGGDPYLSAPLGAPAPAGRYAVELTMASTARGRAQLFWRERGVAPAFFRDRSVLFDPAHDGQPHDYRVEFDAAHPVLALRLDPAQAAGEVRLSAVRLKNAEGAVVRAWTFRAEAAADGKAAR